MDKPSDRYLSSRNGIYHYKRRVPTLLAAFDDRFPFIRTSLKTRDLAKARALRDGYERADDDLWGALLSSDSTEAAMQRYRSAVQRVAAMGFTYRTTMEILQNTSGAELIDRLRALTDCKPNSPASNALLGTVQRPSVKVSDAFEVYVNEISASDNAGKSEGQMRDWLKVKRRALNNFIRLVSDKPIGDITREDALTLYRFWQAKIAPPRDKDNKAKKPTHSSSSGNRDIGNMRILVQKYFEHLGVNEFVNPFDRLGFKGKSKKRPPFDVEWIKGKILVPGALVALNDQARGILLAMVETGARPSELCNLTEADIFLNGPTPYLSIRGGEWDEDELEEEEELQVHEVKTDSSVREIPLVGVALEVFKKQPSGFPRYFDKGTNLSATLNKHFKKHGLFPTRKHKIYSLRHSFEDRMVEGDFDTEVRMMLMGHHNARPAYGNKGRREWQAEQLRKIALPFDPLIV
jgi:integrase